MKRSSTLRLGCAAIIFSAIAAPVFADLKVVDDTGGGSAETYYQQLNPEPEVSAARSRPLSKPPTEANMLPVTSLSITPGQVVRRKINAPGLRPFFIVGADDLSRAWLASRREALLSMGAMGMIVNVQTADQLQSLRDAGQGLTMLPTPGDDVAKRLALEHYPALVTFQSIEQ